MIANGSSLEEAISYITNAISDSGGLVDYVKVVDSETLDGLAQTSKEPMRLLVAAKFGPARLIDNMAV